MASTSTCTSSSRTPRARRWVLTRGSGGDLDISTFGQFGPGSPAPTASRTLA